MFFTYWITGQIKVSFLPAVYQSVFVHHTLEVFLRNILTLYARSANGYVRSIYSRWPAKTVRIIKEVFQSVQLQLRVDLFHQYRFRFIATASQWLHRQLISEFNYHKMFKGMRVVLWWINPQLYLEIIRQKIPRRMIVMYWMVHSQPISDVIFLINVRFISDVPS